MDAMLQKGHRYTAGMAAKLQHALRWIEFYVKFYVQGYRDTEVKEGSHCICVVAVEGTRMLNLLNMKMLTENWKFIYISIFKKNTQS